jgi:hypothetical protein
VDFVDFVIFVASWSFLPRLSAIAAAKGGRHPAPMSVHDSALDLGALAYARALLKPPIKRESLWSPLLASAFAAVAALALATTMLTSPPLISDTPAKASHPSVR